MNLKTTFLLSLLFLLFSAHLNAQVTTSKIAGNVKDEKGKPLPGAIVEAVHEPSGSKYGTDTKNDGSFNMENLRVGGPYKITISFGGAVVRTYENVFLQLGETYGLDVTTGGPAKELQAVTITSSRDNLFNNQRNGASTTITELEINTLPSISRSINDFTRLTPQSTGSSFEGRNSLYNNVQLNGANFNNSFGLSSGLPGGGQPFPMDAVQQIQVGVSTFDVRQSDFTGANINIVTRSGTNDFTGSAYTFYRDQSFNGSHVDSYDLPPFVSTVNHIYGARLGGPIIKNKLFFFVNGEYENSISPSLSPAYVASGNGASGPNVSRPNADSLQELSNFVKQKYGYNTGAFPGAPGFQNTFANEYIRLVARLDYNINDNNKLDASFMHYNSSIPSLANGSSAATGSLGDSRTGTNSLAYDNTIYNTKHVVDAYSVELLSKISADVSNQLLGAYTHVQDTRSSPSSQFPFVDIESGSGSPNDNYTSLGYELFTYKNDVQYNTLAVYDNVTINKGINNITAGASFQYLTFENSYLPYGTGYYRYNSISDFMTNQAPIAFGYTYPYQGQNGYASVHYGLPGAYAQDKINISHNFTITAGVRVDMPIYLDKITSNPYIDTLKLLNPSGDTTHYNASKWPAAKPIVQPRIGFNWSPLKDKSLQVRGGTGIFMGQIPFVWLTNVPGNNGTVTNNVQINSPTALQYLKFQTTPQAALAQLPANLLNQYFPTQAGNSVPGQIAAVDPNFKMPEVWRTDLAADYKLPWLGLVTTAEVMYTKDIYSVYEFNANQPKPVGTLMDSGDHRLLYPSGRIYPNLSGAYILENSNKGDAYSATVGVARAPRKGFYGSIYYTAMYSEEVSENPGSQASSAWLYTEHVNSPNDATLAPSAYFVPHRVVATLSYRLEYLRHLATTLSLYYNGESGGRFSYLYYSDVNNDAAYNDLIYIPKNANQMNWAPITNRVTGVVLFTPQQEADAFNAYINQDKYLRTHKGQYAQRNGAQMPFYNSFNVKLLQDVFTNIGNRRNSLQASVDIINIANLLNRNWGVQERLAVSGGNIIYQAATDKKGNTDYTMQTITNSAGQQVLPTSTFVPNVGTASTWGMQLGLRYNF